ncbi:MAG TPA: flagellar assembly peptidoglycan hydrolase FlgJ [Candidatus Macondimonas sp.]|nr:flagellar assembly peptidoglycan hydrolase FlgJ [Candidatus Macondimonas sp.]
MIPHSHSLAADPKSLDTLRRELHKASDGGRAEVGRQFESLFIQIMLKNMRSAALSPGATDSDQSRFYQDLFDTQISQQLAQGQGLGIGRALTHRIDSALPQPPSTPWPAAGAPDTFQNLTLNRPALPLSTQSLPEARPNGIASLAPAPAFQLWPRPRANLHQAPQALPPPPVGESTAVPRKADAAPSDWPPRSPEDFIRVLWPHARQAGEELGVSPKVLLAQAALESGWGKQQIRHPDGRPSFNLFGIKAGKNWTGDAVRVSTLEYSGTVSERRLERFRAYDSLSEAFADYARLLKGNPRYRQALNAGDDHSGFAEALQRAGYATDPNYAAKINRIMATRLAHLDQPDPGTNLV